MSTRPKSSLRVLVVDDEPLVGESLKEILEFGGHSAEAVFGANEALSRYEPGAFDLLIIDYSMPGMKGDELAAVIRKRAPNQRIIIITGLVGKLESVVCADLVINKPFELQGFLSAVNDLFQ